LSNFFVSITRKQPDGGMKQTIYRCNIILYKFIMYHNKAYYINHSAAKNCIPRVLFRSLTSAHWFIIITHPFVYSTFLL